MITLATSSVVIYTLTISVLFLTVLILAFLTVLKIAKSKFIQNTLPVRGFFVKNENNSLCPRLRLAAIFVQPATW